MYFEHLYSLWKPYKIPGKKQKMKKKKKGTPEKEETLFWKTHFNIPEIIEIPEHVVHLNLKESGITDDELLYIVKRIKKIDMLDLHYTGISNEGIKHLIKLDSLKELRLKGITGIDNGCMLYISQIKKLKFLHVRHTAVNVDGLKEILCLQNLKTVLVSDNDTQENIDKKMKEITASIPLCEFCVNNTNYAPKQPQSIGS